MAKCPKCDQAINTFTVATMNAGMNKVAVYTCPRCHYILGASESLENLSERVADAVKKKFGASN